MPPETAAAHRANDAARYAAPAHSALGPWADRDDLAFLVLRVVAAGAIIFMALVRVPGTPLLPSVPAAAPLMAVISVFVLLGMFTRIASLLAGFGMVAILIAGRAGGQHFIFEPTRDLIFACCFFALSIAGSGQLAYRPPVPDQRETDRGALALSFLRVTVGFALILIEGLSKAIPAVHALAAHKSFGYVAFIGQLGFPVPAFTTTLAILNETLWPLLVMLGIFARPLSAIIVLHMLIAYTVSAHFGQEDAVTALLYAAAYTAVAIAGPGRYAVISYLPSSTLRPTPSETAR